MADYEKALVNYFKVLKGEIKPRFQLAKSSGALSKKVFDAIENATHCELCERKCQVNRMEDEKGFCKVGSDMVVSSCFVHKGEEEFLVPSFTVFFMSCNFECQFCQNWSVSQRKEIGHIMNDSDMAEAIDKQKNIKNVNFVGGEPTPNIPFILKTLRLVKSNIPVVWNSNFYMSEKSMELLNGIVDVYLSDWKYGNNICAMKYSKVQNYYETVERNHLLAFGDSELVIRHLVLPGHFECCTKVILDFIADNFKDKALVNLMDQYMPVYNSEQFPEINKRVSREEFQKVVEYAEKLGLNFIT